MPTLTISTQHLEQICTHAEQCYPRECCGLILGKIDSNSNKTVVELMPTENAWDADSAALFEEMETADQPVTTQERRYTIDPQVFIAAQKQGRDRHLSIIGIYHSHPDHAAIPSEFDRVCAWPQYSYIIVSVKQAKANDIQNWCLDENQQFQPEEMISTSVNSSSIGLSY
ncbi:M67 family metallopeptidase [Limnoraphis robusta]|uniref:M67 family metallopeptidase n=1 Tax=Limnoraphis robusta TaxID=1118279 RepID=UPI002B1ECC1C|nr:M67 family metallopeptidase [Limnoraphis robusta]MEA5495618.1 M67 family metallopeptidase [Limnoraphis robusta BA-68 BA1]